jgi:hypothetical protein
MMATYGRNIRSISQKSMSSVLWNTTQCVDCPLRMNGRFWGKWRFQYQCGVSQSLCKKIHLLATFFMLVSCSAYSTTFKMEVTYTSEMFVDFQKTTWHYMIDAGALHNHSFENFTSCTIPVAYLLLISILKNQSQRNNIRLIRSSKETYFSAQFRKY